MRDIFASFKESDYYVNMSKSDKKTLTEKVFKQQNIAENMKLKKFYCDRKIIKGINYKNILLNYIKNIDDEEYLN